MAIAYNLIDYRYQIKKIHKTACNILWNSIKSE